MSQREILLEFHRIGHLVKVTAIDPVTLIEVSILGPAATPEAELRRTAIAKLDYVLRRRRGGTQRPGSIEA
jgi:hypothetical protein